MKHRVVLPRCASQLNHTIYTNNWRISLRVGLIEMSAMHAAYAAVSDNILTYIPNKTGPVDDLSNFKQDSFIITCFFSAASVNAVPIYL